MIICQHPRQVRPDRRSQSLPCAWPECAAGINGLRLIIPIAPILRTIDRSKPDVAFKRVEYERQSFLDPRDHDRWFEWRFTP